MLLVTQRDRAIAPERYLVNLDIGFLFADVVSTTSGITTRCSSKPNKQAGSLKTAEVSST